MMPSLSKNALSIIERHLGINNIKRGKIVKTIGLAYLSKGKQEAAKAHLLRAKDIFETTFSEDHIWV